MRLATYNVENLFERPRAMNLDSWEDGRAILEDFQRLNDLIHLDVYSTAVQSELLAIMKRHRGLATQGVSKFLRLHEVRGKLLRRSASRPVQIAASGRRAWTGWFELEKEPVKATATRNIARVVGLLQADVLGVVEAENRIALKHFNHDDLAKVQVPPFDHVMLIDGNDDRGIDVGILTRAPFEIARIRSHVDDTDAQGIIFSRDCPEYEVKTAQGNTLLVLVNHFKSKGYGDPGQSAAKRSRQARRVRAIYEERVQEGYEYVAIVGDLNETPDESPMDPLLRDGSALIDIMKHPKFQGDGRPGTHGNGTASGKLDYILMSPKLSQKVSKGGIERRGVWGGQNGTLFPHLPTIKVANDAASDHAALWVDLKI